MTLASSSKKEIVAFCDKLFAEPFATPRTPARAVAAWCPPMMQTAGVASDEAEPAAETPSPTGGRASGLSSRDPRESSPRGSTLPHPTERHPMAILKFSPPQLRRKSPMRACKTFLPNWNGPWTGPP